MTPPKSTLITGGGVIGLNIALQLQAQGRVVTLCDVNRLGSASYGNAGHIATEQAEPLASMATVRSAWRRLFVRGGALSLPPKGIGAWLPFSLRMLYAARPEGFARGKVALKALLADAMPAWKRRVVDIDAADLLREDGHFVVWETPETALRGLKSWAATDTGTARFRPVNEAERAQLSSLMHKKNHKTPESQIAGAIRFEGTAQISDTKRMLETLAKRFVERGGVIIDARVLRLECEGTQASVRLEDGRQLKAEAVIVSAGIGSKVLMEPLGYHVPMIAERGYHIQAPSAEWPKDMPPVVFEDRSMIVTGFESGLRAASFVEFNRIDAKPDGRKWARLRKHVGELGLSFEGEGAQWIGVRPTLPDYLPAIGRARGIDNLYYAFGHQHLGLTLGAVTAERVAEMIRSGEGPKAFDLSRFN